VPDAHAKNEKPPLKKTALMDPNQDESTGSRPSHNEAEALNVERICNENLPAAVI